MKYGWHLMIALVTFGHLGTARGSSDNVNEIPFGNDPSLSCLGCHTDPFGDTSLLTPFGDDSAYGRVNDEVDWASFYDRDADGDCFTNGAELGDPTGEWTIGEPDPEPVVGFTPTDPNDGLAFPAGEPDYPPCLIPDGAPPPDGGPIVDPGDPAIAAGDPGPIDLGGPPIEDGPEFLGPPGCAGTNSSAAVFLLLGIWALRGLVRHNPTRQSNRLVSEKGLKNSGHWVCNSVTLRPLGKGAPL